MIFKKYQSFPSFIFLTLILCNRFLECFSDEGAGSLLSHIRQVHRSHKLSENRNVPPHHKNHIKLINGTGLHCGSYVGTRQIKPHCIKNDSYCGEWHGRQWHPLGCEYRDITSEQARKCMAGKTLAFIGDSQIRDLGVAVGLFLIGQDIETSPTHKFDKKGDSIWHNCTKIGWFYKWGGDGNPDRDRNRRGKGTYNGYLFPKHEDAVKNDWNFQVQVWELFCNQKISNGQMDDVLGNKMINQTHDTNETLNLKPLDLAFWNHGLHDYGFFNTRPYGQHYYNAIVTQFIQRYKTSPTPLVWLSMNPQCRNYVPKMYVSGGSYDQAEMVEEANWLTHKKMREDKRPYFDAAALLRTNNRCNISCDGVHVKMFVDIMRAKVLFNYLCDENMNWRGKPDLFI